MPRLADGEVADVDHLLHLAFAFGDEFCPISSVTSLPRSVFCSRKALPSCRTVSPRTGPGVARHFTKASWARRDHLFVILRRCGPELALTTCRRPAKSFRWTSPPPRHSPAEGPGIFLCQTEILENGCHTYDSASLQLARFKLASWHRATFSSAGIARGANQSPRRPLPW